MIRDEFMLMRKPSGGGVVTDGLVYYFDGEDEIVFKSASGTSNTRIYDAVDRVSGLPFDLIVLNNNRAENVDGSVVVHANTSETAGAISIRFETPNTFEAVKTVEVVYNTNGNTPYRFKGAPTSFNSNTGLMGQGNKYHFPMRNGVVGDSYSAMVQGIPLSSHQVVGTYTNDTDNMSVIYLNADSSMSTIVNRYLDISCNIPLYISISSGINFSVSAVRLYDRVLTPEEILQNYNYEKSIGRIM